MFFNPLTSWLVALIADGLIVGNEKAKQRKAYREYQQKYGAGNLKQTHPEPHRDPKDGKIVIENSKLYYEDLKNYGAVQAQKWVEQGKYNLTPEELEKQRKRLKENER